ncbi:hypothetical protein C4552_02900 [Candidatus Parcubacteria bacterium]|nr:MAG: hypothetical protein C4552_02900 [Candidatus Parcubacteria bacterium]
MADIGARLRQSRLVWRLKTMPAVIRHAFRRPAVTAEESRLAELLRRDGVALTHLDDLFGPDLKPALRAWVADQRIRLGIDERIRAVRDSPIDGKKDSFLVDLWGGPHILDFNHPLLRTSLSDPMLNVVSAYLGMWPKFREFWLHVTVPVPTGTNPYASQRWHADPDDRRMVKTFLYLSDVDETAGPFTYIRGTQEGGRWRHLFPFAPKQRSRHPDPAFIERTIPPEDIFIATGNAGSLVFCDTSGIHRGGYATAKERVMYTSVFTTPGSARATQYAPSARAPADLDPRVRYAVA